MSTITIADVRLMKKLVLWICLVLALCPVLVLADARHDSDIVVKVAIDAEKVSVDVSMPVAANRELVWAVLTDFSHMAGFIANVRESKVNSSQGDVLVVTQRGTARYGPLEFPFESTREIRLTPWDSIQSRQISGNMRKMQGLTRIFDNAGATRVEYHADSIPGTWIPPLLGKVFIAHEVREQFQQMRDEMMRRKQLLAR
jgi:hypothetical protein